MRRFTILNVHVGTDWVLRLPSERRVARPPQIPPFPRFSFLLQRCRAHFHVHANVCNFDAQKKHSYVNRSENSSSLRPPLPPPHPVVAAAVVILAWEARHHCLPNLPFPKSLPLLPWSISTSRWRQSQSQRKRRKRRKGRRRLPDPLSLTFHLPRMK